MNETQARNESTKRKRETQARNESTKRNDERNENEMNEILKAIEIVKIAQKHHAETWAGMMGTSWEREDKRMKHNFLAELFAMMDSGKVNPKRIDEIITTVKA